MFEGWEHERNSRERTLKQGDVFIDVGACVGGWAIPAAIIGREVCAFEPNTNNAQILNANALLNHLDNITVLDKVVWNNNGPIHFDGWNAVEGDGALAVTLDSFCDDNNIIPDLIKVDVEGAEFRVIEGAQALIKRHKPRLLIEAHKQYDPNAVGLVTEAVMDLNDYTMCITARDGIQAAHLYFT